jgi:transcriptional regulator with XRE-family HTH domain
MTAAEFRETLAALGLTQRAFAAEVLVDIGTVNRWAKGRRPIPGIVDAYLLRLLAHPAGKITDEDTAWFDSVIKGRTPVDG